MLPTTRYGHRQVSELQPRRADLGAAARGRALRDRRHRRAARRRGVRGHRLRERLGLDKIRAHATQLTERLQQELPPLGYAPLTPRSNPTPILAFALKDAAATSKALHDGKVTATVVANESRLRLSVSVFNTHDDIDRVVEVLGGRTTSQVRR